MPDSSDSSSEDNPCLCTLCLVEESRTENCCQYFSKCRADCETENVDCVTKLSKFLKMMDQVFIVN